MGISSGTVTVPQGSLGAPAVFSITAKNGLSGQVQIALAGLPAGVVSNPASSFMGTPGADTQVVFGAAAMPPPEILWYPRRESAEN
jgi:hypothetical protein